MARRIQVNNISALQYFTHVIPCAAYNMLPQDGTFFGTANARYDGFTNRSRTFFFTSLQRDVHNDAEHIYHTPKFI